MMASALVSPAEYRQFIEQVELQQIMLASASVRRIRTPLLDGGLSFEHKLTKRDFTEADGGFEATLHMLVRLADEEPAPVFAEIRVAYSAVYRSELEMTDAIFEVFGDLNLPVNLYPYLREYVHTASSRMGLPGLVLPTLKRS